MFSIVLLLTFLIVSILLISPKTVMAHEDSGYSHDNDIGYENKNWMSTIPDDTHLSYLSIPGTHNSMSFYWGDIAQTQSMPLKTQLNSGIRFLDIRCYYERENFFEIYHGAFKQYSNFETVLDTVSQFLKENPTETVLMRVRQEQSSASNTDFNNSFLNYVSRYPNLFWDRNTSYSPNNPKLQEVRGKIVILYNVSGISFGIGYGQLKIYDKYSIGTNWDLYEKWTEIKSIIATVANSANYWPIYLTYLSASGGSFPYFVVSGHSNPATGAPRLATGLTNPGWKNTYPDFPRVNPFGVISTIAFEGTNILTKDFINSNRFQRVGIIATDFPGSGLIDCIIKANNEKYFLFRMLGSNDHEFASLELDLFSNTLSIQTNQGEPNPQYTDSYLRIEIYNPNHDIVNTKDFIGNMNYIAMKESVAIQDGYILKIISKQPFKVRYTGPFSTSFYQLTDTETYFSITSYGLRKDNVNDIFIKFLGYGDNQYGNLKLSLDFNKLIFRTNPGHPHPIFEESYLNIDIMDENYGVIYNKNYIGSSNYGSECTPIKIQDGYKVKFISKEPSRVRLYNVIQNTFKPLSDVESTFTISRAGLQETNKNNIKFRFFGFEDIEYASLYLDLDNKKLIFRTNALRPHFLFDEVYLSIEVFDNNNISNYTKNYIGNQKYSDEVKTLPIQDGYKIKFISLEPVRVRFNKIIEFDANYLQNKETIFSITNSGLINANRDFSLFKFLGYANREFAIFKIDFVSSKLFFRTHPGYPHHLFHQSYLILEIFDENNNLVYSKYYLGNLNYEYEFTSFEAKENYKIKITSKEPSRINFYETPDSTLIRLQNKQTTFTITKSGLKMQ